MDEDDPRDRYRPSSLDDNDRCRNEYYSHCATTSLYLQIRLTHPR
jgi:hypothetical protein